ncbi:bifunctional pantoate--beta-alanine ligase/(d)CMP kinase [Prochlorococcus marinus]|uniref:Bifunctional pantoate ligase/cytidylate kinase n=1 Tax=Prochlorococcus marinus XMU1408 TaxID=2213228 RepID=A0A318R1F6_PROMR|nr:bifunctional pantoate--beta-alanine ligase/(d)CMP kinase [Prochlorococcus marinus]MBW3042814.1 cytidylate kinase [Prochlorococcus marinus str. XMU1408]PYE00641.1 cytidylate kinase [Prochlorococcus marinus XMU1408]
MVQKIFQTNAELKDWLSEQNSAIIFIPTMGGLHPGHQYLIEKAKARKTKPNQIILVSIFINPLQFGKNEDFKKYPRNISKDAELAFNAGADAIWTPDYFEVFPGGENSHFKIQVPQTLNNQLCGAERPGHFDGVATVIIRLVKIIRPEKLILGEKDWQQLIIIRRLFQELSIPIKIESYSTQRDQSGFAYSSRNSYLSDSERLNAQSLPSAIKVAKTEFEKEKIINLKKIASILKENHLQIEYLKVVDPFSLKETENINGLCLLAAAVKCGSTRLIDHTFLMQRKPIIAIDGPAGAGKSTVTKAFAKRLGFIYLDTGAMYRAVTWLIISNSINPSDQAQIKNILKDSKLEFQSSNFVDQKILINNIDVTEKIRSPEVTSRVSEIAKQQFVRELLTKQQQVIGEGGGLVAEGRDIGTAVFPDADVKIFLTATPKERAKRRSIDLEKRGYEYSSIEDLEKEIEERDKQDSEREIAPLKKAHDAVELCTDGMNIEKVLEELTYIFRSKIPEEVWATPNL